MAEPLGDPECGRRSEHAATDAAGPVQAPPDASPGTGPDAAGGVAHLEHLQLGLEEAFFLAYALGCLDVADEDGVPAPPLRRSLPRPRWPWMRCGAYFLTRSRHLHRRMPCTTICAGTAPGRTASHFSCGWVPKSGLKFGVEFLAYRKGPAFFHATCVSAARWLFWRARFSVAIRTLDATTLRAIDGRPALPWPMASALNRMSAQVAKELVVCHVLQPALTAAELRSPECVRRMAVSQVLVRRWLPERARARADEEEEA
jgi:tRNA-splicing endonuclease subunit Sen2